MIINFHGYYMLENFEIEGRIMKYKKYFKNNKDYFKFYNINKDRIMILSINKVKSRKYSLVKYKYCIKYEKMI